MGMSKLDGALGWTNHEKRKEAVKALMLELLEDCKHTINTTDENSWVSWDEVSQKVKDL